MTTRVYRKLKLGLIRNDIRPLTQSSHSFHTFINPDRGHSQNPSPARHGSQFPLQVNITKDITVDDGHERSEGSGLAFTVRVSKNGRDGIGSSNEDSDSIMHGA